MRRRECRAIHRARIDPPRTLHVPGNVDLRARPTISVAGARRMTPQGNPIAGRIWKVLTRARRGTAPEGMDARADHAVARADPGRVRVAGGTCRSGRASRGPPDRRWHRFLGVEGARRVDDFVENSGLPSSEVLAARFDRGLCGVIRQLPARQFRKVLL
jgi:hypothetical protein